MATFSFTISASDVNSLKDTTGQSAFDAVADKGLSRNTKHNVLTAKFGDGYEQKVLYGINAKQDTFTISFNNRTAEDINLIALFLDDKAGKNFDFVITDSYSSGALSDSTIKVCCEEYNVTFLRDNYHSLTCTLKRVYEP